MAACKNAQALCFQSTSANPDRSFDASGPLPKVGRPSGTNGVHEVEQMETAIDISPTSASPALEAVPTSVASSSVKGSAPSVLRSQSVHPLDPLTPTEIAVAITTVRAAGATPEERDGMRFFEVVLQEPDKNVIALADSFFFPPYQPTVMYPKGKGGAIIPLQLPPRQARLIAYNKNTNETTVWFVELTEVHAAARGGHHRGKVISCEVIPDVQPPMVITTCLCNLDTSLDGASGQDGAICSDGEILFQ